MLTPTGLFPPRSYSDRRATLLPALRRNRTFAAKFPAGGATGAAGPALPTTQPKRRRARASRADDVISEQAPQTSRRIAFRRTWRNSRMISSFGRAGPFCVCKYSDPMRLLLHHRRISGGATFTSFTRRSCGCSCFSASLLIVTFGFAGPLVAASSTMFRISAAASALPSAPSDN